MEQLLQLPKLSTLLQNFATERPRVLSFIPQWNLNFYYDCPLSLCPKSIANLLLGKQFSYCHLHQLDGGVNFMPYQLTRHVCILVPVILRLCCILIRCFWLKTSYLFVLENELYHGLHVIFMCRNNGLRMINRFWNGQEIWENLSAWCHFYLPLAIRPPLTSSIGIDKDYSSVIILIATTLIITLWRSPSIAWTCAVLNLPVASPYLFLLFTHTCTWLKNAVPQIIRYFYL